MQIFPWSLWPQGISCTPPLYLDFRPKYIFWHFQVRPKSWKSHIVTLFLFLKSFQLKDNDFLSCYWPFTPTLELPVHLGYNKMVVLLPKKHRALCTIFNSEGAKDVGNFWGSQNAKIIIDQYWWILQIEMRWKWWRLEKTAKIVRNITECLKFQIFVAPIWFKMTYYLYAIAKC